MDLADGYTDLPFGKLASVVTYLGMLSRPSALAATPSDRFSVKKIAKPDLDWYRALYRAVGETWLWFSRLAMTDEEVLGIIHDPQVDTFALSIAGGDAARGLVELDRRSFPAIEISSFGVTADLVGKGAGKYLMNYTLRAAWSHNPRRVWLHTCTLDHPRALQFYLNAGFTAYKRAIEVADDPRLIGLIDARAASHIPILRRTDRALTEED